LRPVLASVLRTRPGSAASPQFAFALRQRHITGIASGADDVATHSADVRTDVFRRWRSAALRRDVFQPAVAT
jgi:hypothetical protein